MAGWDSIDAFYRDSPQPFAWHHVASFDDFVHHGLPKTVKTVPIAFVRAGAGGQLRHRVRVLVGGDDASLVRMGKPVFVDGSGTQRPMYPNDARVRNDDYMADVFADVKIEYETLGTGTVKEVWFRDVRIGSVPIMVGSCLCVTQGVSPRAAAEMGESPFDQGGYFIVGGKEKVLIGLEKLAANRLLISPLEDHPKYALEGLLVGLSEEDTFEKLVEFRVYKAARELGAMQNCIVVGMRDIAAEVPVFTMFRVLGVESDVQIMQHIVGDVHAPENAPLVAFLYGSAMHAAPKTRQAALEELSQFVQYARPEHVSHVVLEDFLRNTTGNVRRKAMFFGHVVNRLVRVCLGQLNPKTRDSFLNKRVSSSGELIYGLFRDGYNRFRRTIRRRMEEAYSSGNWEDRPDIENLVKAADVASVFDPEEIRSMMLVSLRGNWAKKEDPAFAGVVQDLNRISFMGYVSHLRRVSAQISSSLKLVEPRRLDGTQWGIMCPTQSPDGAGVGIDKHLASLAHVTVGTDPAHVHACLHDLGVVAVEDVGVTEFHTRAKVFVNNDIFGVTTDAGGLVAALRTLRRAGRLNAFVGVAWDRGAGEVSVFTEPGRLVRPLFVVGSGSLGQVPPGATWESLFCPSGSGRRLDDPSYVPLKAGKVGESTGPLAVLEYLDVEEANNAMIAMWPGDLAANPDVPYTHCELHPSTVLSLYTNTIPFAHHNQSPRNVFSGQQGKQAIGVYATNFNSRMDSASYILHHPQRPVVTTRYGAYTRNDGLPNGENLIVAIQCFGGYNQEDAVILNRTSCQRGMFNVTCFKSFVEQEEANRARGTQTVFANARELQRRGVPIRTSAADDGACDESGMPRLNAHVSQGRVLVGKVVITTERGADGARTTSYRDASLVADKTIEGSVDRVFVFDEEGGKRAKVRLRKVRSPAVGDKMASRHGQKGVVGMLLDQWDMPFSRDGLVPDIIVNPHAFPSRMTVGHLLECIVAKAGCAWGFRADGTAFERHDFAAYERDLSDAGYHRHGDEVLYDGRTGRQIEAAVFFGPTFYFRLKHMVADKINYRHSGPISNVTRQPAKGRANDGGLRLGEMERDAIAGHGAAAFLKEAFIEKSDGCPVALDESGAPWEGGPRSTVEVPFALKAFTQEANALAADVRLLTSG